MGAVCKLGLRKLPIFPLIKCIVMDLVEVLRKIQNAEILRRYRWSSAFDGNYGMD
jgi:hypothetical protein